jgi:hypothetical protein
MLWISDNFSYKVIVFFGFTDTMVSFVLYFVKIQI